MKKIYPKLYIENVKQITKEMLKKYNIKGILLDVDNTLIDYKCVLLEGTEKWCEDLKQEGIKFCILSNSHKKNRVEKISKTLNMPYINFAKKPLKNGFLRAEKILDLKKEEIAMVGDQLFTDVLGANRVNMFSILVDPVDKKESIITRIKRPIEKYFIKKITKYKMED